MIQPYRAICGSFRPVLEVSTFRSSHLVFLLLDLLPVVTHLSLDFLQEAFTNTPLSSKIGLDVLICSHSIFYLFLLRYVAYCITVDCLCLFWALGQYSVWLLCFTSTSHNTWYIHSFILYSFSKYLLNTL